MRDSLSVITDATDGIAKQLAAAYDVSLTRIYEMLGNQCVYPKCKELIRKIGAINKDRVRIIKADLDAMFAEILGEELPCIDVAELHRENSEAVSAILEGKPRPVQIKEVRDSIACNQKVLIQLETGSLTLDAVRTDYANGAH